MKDIVWTEYMRYRSTKRRIDLTVVEHIARHSTERYVDNETQRILAVGRHKNAIVLVPYEESESAITPITVHSTTRKQINFRIKTKRYSHE